jgi:hypothetical protein
MRINSYIIMTDIAGCFDRIIPSITSILNRKNGVSKQAVQMHGKTLGNAQYYLKTKFGISDTFYSHTEQTLIYGNGQGAGDSPSQWNQESAVLISLFHQEAKGAKITHPVNKVQTSIAMTAFADDRTIHGNNTSDQTSPIDLAKDVQLDLTCWNEYLHAAGHFLELSKCACYLVAWGFDADGRPYAIPKDELGVDIKIRQRDDSIMTIPQLSIEDGQKSLGVMKCPSGSQAPEINRLRDKCDGIARRVAFGSLSRIEARLAYETSYIPAMRYSLMTTAIHQLDMEKIQQKATAAFLSKMGFNRNMPREVVFGHKLHQGLGIRHL